MTEKRIQLSHGGGGEESQQLLDALFFKAFGNEILLQAEDAALLTLEGAMAFTTDSFTVNPLFFPGGDIGQLAVTGTLNDLAMRGAEPLYLSCAFMIEEGLPWRTLQAVVESMAVVLHQAGVKIVCGDTKVVPKGAVDQLFIATSGIGRVLPVKPSPSARRLQPGDAILVSRDLGCHGAVVMAERHQLLLPEALLSDCAVVWPVVKALLEAGIEVHALRDATRGGLAALLNEWAQASQVGIEVEEGAVPIREAVQGLCELLGMDAMTFANEGTFVISLPANQAEAALAVMSQFEICENAALIGHVQADRPGLVMLSNAWGSRRVLHRPKGELLPRIC